jgi:hypothetical protein
MFEGGIVIFLFVGFMLYSTKDDSRFMFCFLIGCGVMFFSKSSRDSRISSLLPFFSDSFACFVSSFSFLLVSILNSFSILSIFAISINAMFLGRFIFYNFRFLLPDKIGFCMFIRSFISGSFIYGEFLL